MAGELGREGADGEALGLRAGFFDIDFLGLTEVSAAAAAESSLNFLTASLACLASFAWRLDHSSGKSSPRLMLVGSATWTGANGALGHGGFKANFFMYFGVT